MTKKTQASLAVVEDDAGLATLAEDLGITGLEEADNQDVQLPTLTLNFKGKNADGDPIAANHWYNTVTEEVNKKLRLQLLNLHKSREWREYVEGDGTHIRCRSFDNVTGRMENDVERPCDGCPDYTWQTIDGKRTRRCGDVWNIGAYDLDAGTPAIIRFKKTGLHPIKSYLNKHHLRRRKTKSGAMGDWPLFFFEVEATGRMSDNGNYAMPVLEKVGTLPKEQIQLGHESAKFLAERAQDITASASERDRDEGEAPARDEIDASAFVDNAPQASAPNRF